jgi:hypothetical protein
MLCEVRDPRKFLRNRPECLPGLEPKRRSLKSSIIPFQHTQLPLAHYLLPVAAHTVMLATALGYGPDGRYFIGPGTQWVPGTLLPGLKRPKREADNSPPSTSEITNA